MLNRYWRFLRENGWYLFCMNVVAHFAAAVRSRAIGHRLGVGKINIGPRPYLRGLSFIEIGEDFSAESDLWIEAITHHGDQVFTPRIRIGSHARVSRSVHIAATNSVEIGDHVLIGSKVLIIDHNHGQYSTQPTSPEFPPSQRPLDGDRKVTIGCNVWLCDGVVVTPGSTIGDGSVIGANSVVHGTIPAFSIASGIPATVRKTFSAATQQWVNVQ